MIPLEHTGSALPTMLAVAVDDVETTLVVVAATGWPTGAAGSFYATLDAGTELEEKVLVTSRTGSVLSDVTRGVDDTLAVAHDVDATVAHTLTAVEFQQLNDYLLRPRYGCRLYLSANVPLPSQELLIVPLNGATFDVGNMQSGNAAVAPVTGRYLVIAQVLHSATSGPIMLRIRINGQYHAQVQLSETSDWTDVQYQDILDLDFGSEVTLGAWQMSPSAAQVGGDPAGGATFLAVVLL